MTDPIYSECHSDYFSFVVVFDIYVIVLVSLLNRMFAFMLHSEYTSCFMAKSVVWHNFQSSNGKQARETFQSFVLNSHFIQPSECKYVLFVCLSDCKSFIPLRFRYFAWRFSFHIVDLSRESRVVPPILWLSRKRIEIIFRGHCPTRKLKSAKNNPHIFETKPWKFGGAKISHYTVVSATSWENLFMTYANNKGADQPANLHSLISTIVVHCLDSIIPLLSTSEISNL